MRKFIKLIVFIFILVILISCEDPNDKTDKDIKTDTTNPVITEFDRYEIYEIDSESVVIRGYHSLEEITVLEIPESISFDSFNIKKKVIGIGEEAFANNFNGNIHIKEVIIPSTVKEIGKNAFANNEYLEKITFKSGSNYRIIEEGTFSNIPNLREFKIPENVMGISEYAFKGTNINKFIGNQYFIWTENLLINTNASNQTNLVAVYANPFVEEIRFPDNVKSMSGSIFENNKNIKKIDLNQITHVSPNAFTNSSIEEIVNANNVESANISSFKGTKWLENQKDQTIILGKVLLRYVGDETDILIPEGIVCIGENCFNSKTLVKVTIPSTVERIGSNAFIKCTNLKTVIFNPKMPPDIWDNSFYKDTILYVDDNYLNRYKNSTSFMFISNQIKALSEL